MNTPPIPDLLQAVPEPYWLVLLFVMTFLANGTIPLPVTAYMILLGQLESPVSVVLVGTLGTVSGWAVISPRLRQWLGRLNPERFIQKVPFAYRKAFVERPGLGLLFFNALPFPIDPIRFLALMSGYSRTRTLLFMGLGRLIRNILLVSLGAWLSLYQNVFVGVMAALFVVPFAFKLIQRLLKRFSLRQNELEPVTVATPEQL